MNKTIHQIRLENFELLVQEAGSVVNLAKRCGYDKPTYLYQVRSQRPKANGTILQIGKRMASKLEHGMGKPMGWLDIIHSQMQTAAHTAYSDTLQSSLQTISLAFTGASGMPYGIRLLEELLKAGKTVWLMYSQAAQIVAHQEMNLELPSSSETAQATLCRRYHCSPEQLRVFGKNEWFAPVASGNSFSDAMVICPASMGVVAAVAHGMSDNLIERAADVAIKEKRPLIIVPRETPLSTLHLENLLKLAQLGCTILPPAAGFYYHPQTVDDIVNFVVARILDQLGITHQLVQKWST